MGLSGNIFQLRSGFSFDQICLYKDFILIFIFWYIFASKISGVGTRLFWGGPGTHATRYSYVYANTVDSLLETLTLNSMIILFLILLLFLVTAEWW